MVRLNDDDDIRNRIFELVKRIEPDIDYDYIMESSSSYILYRKLNKKKNFDCIKTFTIEKDLLS